MVIWDFVRKMFQGKPVFDVSDMQDESPTQPSTKMPINEKDQRIIPEVAVTHCTTHLTTSSMQVTVWFTNSSHEPIRLTKIIMLDTTTSLARRLNPGEAHEAVVYHGAAPLSDNIPMAHLYYKAVGNGEYFRADFAVEYDCQSDGRYCITALHPQSPVHQL